MPYRPKLRKTCECDKSVHHIKMNKYSSWANTSPKYYLHRMTETKIIHSVCFMERRWFLFFVRIDDFLKKSVWTKFILFISSFDSKRRKIVKKVFKFRRGRLNVLKNIYEIRTFFGKNQRLTKYETYLTIFIQLLQWIG